MTYNPLKSCKVCGFTMLSVEKDCISCEVMLWETREAAAIAARNDARAKRLIANELRLKA